MALPPFQFVSEGVLFAVMFTAQRDAPGIVWLLGHSSVQLSINDRGGAQMCSFDRGIVAANATGQTPDILKMPLVSNARHSLAKLAHTLALVLLL